MQFFFLKVFHLLLNVNILDRICTAGWPITNREDYDSAGWTMVSPDQQFLCNGQVIEWRYQGKTSNAFQAIVWRSVDDSDTQFRIVGINEIPAVPAGAVNTPVIYSVPESERITVKAGDVIGWSFGESVLTYNVGGHYRVGWLVRNLLGSIQVNQVYDINSAVEERDYSIAATVTEHCEYSIVTC